VAPAAAHGRALAGPAFRPAALGTATTAGPAEPWQRLEVGTGRGCLLVVVAVSVGATLLFTRGDNGGESPTGTASPTSTSGPASDVASANDKGPVAVITEDPTCAPWTPINNTLANRQKNGWTNRDPSIPAVTWSPEMRTMFREVGAAMREAADQTVALVKLTPHRVMRELYEQFIAYARAYDDSIPTYESADNHLANVAVSATSVLSNICNAADFGSAAARGALIAPAQQPTSIAPLGNPAKPERFLTSPDSVCPAWTAQVAQVNTDIAAWANTDPSIPVHQWSSEQTALTAAVTPVLRENADGMQSLGKGSTNPVLQDLAVLGAQYQFAYLQALPTYGPSDHYLYTAAAQAAAMINEACLAVGD
jgi:hypothetical protein